MRFSYLVLLAAISLPTYATQSSATEGSKTQQPAAATGPQATPKADVTYDAELNAVTTQPVVKRRIYGRKITTVRSTEPSVNLDQAVAAQHP